MSINFNRNRTQEKYEEILEITSTGELVSNKEKFKNYTLCNSDVEVLKPLLRRDALDYFNNAVISFSEGIDSIYLKRFSWATVKLYYSVFYMLRASMACNGFALLRNHSMYRLKLQTDEKPYATGNRKYNSTHSGTIAHYKEVFSGSDVLLTNKIDDTDVYQWLENVREIVNYRDVSFRDPECLDIWGVYKKALDNGDLGTLLDSIQNDVSYIYCFQEEYAVVAIPVKRMQQTIADMSNCGLLNLFQKSKIEYLETVIKSDSRRLHLMDEIKDKI